VPVDALTNFPFSTFGGLRHPKATLQYGLSRLASRLRRAHSVPAGCDTKAVKLRTPAWAPAVYIPGRRANANVTEVSALVLDYDNGVQIKAALRRWAAYRTLWYTTLSHTEAHHRFRTVLPFQRGVTPEEFTRIWGWAHARDSNIDPQCKDPSRAWLFPVRREGSPFRYGVVSTPLLHPDEILPLCPEPEKEPALVDYSSHDDITREWPEGMAAEMRTRLAAVVVDPGERLAIGENLNGVVMGGTIRRVQCPKCGDYSVWWWLKPKKDPLARCNHTKTCQWEGTLPELVLRAEHAGSL